MADDLFQFVLNCNGIENNSTLLEYLRNHNEIIQQLATNQSNNASNTSALLEFVLHLMKTNCHMYTIAVIYLMSIQSETLSESCIEIYIATCRHVFSLIDKNSIKYVPKEASIITNRIAFIGNKYNISKSIIRILLKAIYILRPNENCLISTYSHFLQACIDAQMYSFGTKIINETLIFEIDSNLISSDYLKYYYYSGLCLIGTGNMIEALENFNQVISVPSSVLSEIVICSLKKSKLLSLIINGKSYTLPKLTSDIIRKFFKADIPIYDHIIKLYINNDIIGLNQYIIDNVETLNIDQNYGLAKQVLGSLNNNVLRNLTNTYITMSLNDIKDRCVFLNDNNSDNFNSSINLLIEMISKDEINATIDEISGLVKFGVNKEENNPKILALLERNMMETIHLSEKLRAMQKTVLSSPQYLSKVAPKSQPVMDWEDDHNKGV